MTDKLKVCMIGATAVGKTSLVSRFINSIFRERYSSTIGVQIYARRIEHGDRLITLVLWDLSGEDEFQGIQPAYLRGAAGYLLVADGTRRQTVETAIALEARVRAAFGPLPFVLVLNKTDLSGRWDIDRNTLETIKGMGWNVIHASAKTGEHVDEAFSRLVDVVLAHEWLPWN